MNTQDLSKFGQYELGELGKLLSALKTAKDLTEYMGDGITAEFNPNSGNVFLVDQDYNVAMMNGDTLEDWHNLSYEGHEGFIEDLILQFKAGDIEDDGDVEQLKRIAETYSLDSELSED